MTTEVIVSRATGTDITFRPPNKWKVLFLNDDVTPMDYVIDVLMRVFNHTESTAQEITLSIHNAGRGVAGVFPFEIAEQKVSETIADSSKNGFSLQVDLEQE